MHITRRPHHLSQPSTPIPVMTPPPQVKILRSSDGHEIFAEASGDPAHPHVVLLHGFSLCSAVFDAFCQRQDLLKALYIVRFDLRGHGRSGKPTTSQGHLSSLYAEDFQVVLNAFGLRTPVLVGWSMGGIIGADIVAYLPSDILSGILYISGIPHAPCLFAGAGMPALGSLFTRSTNPLTSQAAMVEFVDGCLASPSAPKITFEMRCMFLGMGALQSFDIRSAILSRQQDAEAFANAAGTIPMSIMYGTGDQLINGAYVELALKDIASDVEVTVVPNAGHTLFWEQPDLTAKTVINFVQRVWSKE
ncbi:Alpha/Beta hydrolase protein [Amylostereum chailletii]|nr:Alpha/Beta hydrolase protein [Amylostereum chailletii]